MRWIGKVDKLILALVILMLMLMRGNGNAMVSKLRMIDSVDDCALGTEIECSAMGAPIAYSLDGRDTTACTLEASVHVTLDGWCGGRGKELSEFEHQQQRPRDH